MYAHYQDPLPQVSSAQYTLQDGIVEVKNHGTLSILLLNKFHLNPTYAPSVHVFEGEHFAIIITTCALTNSIPIEINLDFHITLARFI